MEGGVVVQPQQRYFHPPRYPYGHRGRGIFVQQNFGYQFRNPSALASAQQPSAGNLTGTRARRAVHMRRTVDYYSSVICTLENRIWQRDHRDFRCVQPDFSYNSKVMFPAMHVEYPVQAVPSKNVRTSMNKQPCPIFCVAFTPEGRRLITGASSGEFTLWNGITFNFETILQAHDASVRAMVWSHNDLWMITADHGGFVKYWQTNMNNVKMFQAHKEAVRSLRLVALDPVLGPLQHFLPIFGLVLQCWLTIATFLSAVIISTLIISNYMTPLKFISSKLFTSQLHQMCLKNHLLHHSSRYSTSTI